MSLLLGGAYAWDKSTPARLCAKNAGEAYARGGGVFAGHYSTCSLVGQMWHKLAHWYATNYLEYVKLSEAHSEPITIPACWLCCFLQTQSTHKWRQQWRLAPDVSSQISSAAGNRWICTVSWRRRGFLHVGTLPWQWTQSSPWNCGRRERIVIRMLSTFSRQYMCIEWKTLFKLHATACGLWSNTSLGKP